MLFVILIVITAAFPSFPPVVHEGVPDLVVPKVNSAITAPQLPALFNHINIGTPIAETERSLIYLIDEPGNKYILKAYKAPNLQKLEREYEILKLLSRDRGQIQKINGIYYLPQKYIPGKTLDHVLRQLQGNPAKQQSVIARAAKALRVLHGKGIIHNDSHTGNFIVTPGGEIQLIDFGESLLAKDLTKPEIQEGKSLDLIQMKYFAEALT